MIRGGSEARMTTAPESNESAPVVRRRGRMDGSKKYWWAGAIAVPVAVALIQILPSLFGGGGSSGNTYITNSRIGGDFYFTTNVRLNDAAARDQFTQAVALARDGKFVEAKVLLEQVAAISQSAPVFNNLGVVNAALGDDAAARRNVQQALQVEPGNEAATKNLELLSRPVAGAPGKTILTAAPIQLGADVQASIMDGAVSNFFSFSSPSGSRDMVRVRLENTSTTLMPQMKVFDTERVEVASDYKTTAGANITQQVAVPAGARYYIQVSGFSSTTGTYTLSVAPLKAFDRFEPNEDVLKPSETKTGQDVEANVMDSEDRDMFRVTVSAGPVRVTVTNRSSTLVPEITLLDDTRAQVAHEYSTTAGAHLSAEATAMRPGAWYVRVNGFSGSAGDYTLKVTQ